MDYRALAELVMFSLLGLSVLIGVTGFTLKVFLAPLVQNMIAAYRERGGAAVDDARLERMEMRLLEMEDELRGLRAGVEFDRRLEEGGASKHDGP